MEQPTPPNGRSPQAVATAPTRAVIRRPLVVMPTFEEARNIRQALTGVRRELSSATVLVVDDEGRDGTADLAEEIGRETGQVEVLRRSGKEGLARAYQAGFAWGLDNGYDLLIGMDADLSHDASALPRLLAAVLEGADVAVGSRYVPGGRTVNWPLSRRLLSRGGNLYASHALHTGVADMTSAFRAYRAEALRAVDLDGLTARGYGFLIELIHRMRQAGLTITEVPIVFADRVEGISKMSPRIAAEAFSVVTRIAVAELPGRLRGS